MKTIAISYQSIDLKAKAKIIADDCGLSLVNDLNKDYRYLLHLTHQHLQLVSTSENYQPLIIDFLSGKNLHRQLAVSKNELIAKACGLKKRREKPIKVIDATAGLGRDAFVLANLGCHVLMLERSSIIAALLFDGLTRLKQSKHACGILLDLINVDALQYLTTLNLPIMQPDVIYLDPMFPMRKKSSLVKKEMRIFADIVGKDSDAESLLQLALTRALARVVIKRPKLSGFLSNKKPDIQYLGKSSRFDVYLTD